MIPFLDLKAINLEHQSEIKEACNRVIGSGWYIDGVELKSFEEEFQNVKNEVGNDRFYNGNFTRAKTILEEITLSENLEDFLTLKAYGEL